jgi:hypothetical protein
MFSSHKRNVPRGRIVTQMCKTGKGHGVRIVPRRFGSQIGGALESGSSIQF